MRHSLKNITAYHTGLHNITVYCLIMLILYCFTHTSYSLVMENAMTEQKVQMDVVVFEIPNSSINSTYKTPLVPKTVWPSTQMMTETATITQPYPPSGGGVFVSVITESLRPLVLQAGPEKWLNSQDTKNSITTISNVAIINEYPLLLMKNHDGNQ